MMEIRRYQSDLLLSNMYLIVEEDSAIVIDPFRDVTPAEGLRIEKILLTHEHYDHISGVNDWKAVTGAPVLCSKACAANAANPRKNLSNHFDIFCELQTWMELDEIPETDTQYACHADETFEDEMCFFWKEHEFFLFEMPGHSMGGVGILLDGKYFFSGDSLMENSEIETRMPGGSRAKWREIGQPRLAKLPDGITVYPGHFKEFIYHKEGS